MSASRSQRAQAQRDFAQDAQVPPNVVPAPVANANRRDGGARNQGASDAVVNHSSTSAANVRDGVSLEGIYPHLLPVVLMEQLGSRILNRHSSHPQSDDPQRHRNSVTHNKMLPKKLPDVKKRKQYKRVHAMCLRSQRSSNLEFQKLDLDIAKRTRLTIKREAPIAPKEKCSNHRDCLESNISSLNDSRPLADLANCSIAKRTALFVPHPHTDPEPLAGPSGLSNRFILDSNPRPESRGSSYIQLPTRPTSVSSASTVISVRGSYYDRANNVHRWMNDCMVLHCNDSCLSDENDLDVILPERVAASKQKASKREEKHRKLLEAVERIKTANELAHVKIEEGFDVPSAADPCLQICVGEPFTLTDEDARLMTEVDELAKVLEKEKDAKGDSASDVGQCSVADSGESARKGGEMLEAPIFRPTLKEFYYPIAYFERIWQDAYKYGICKVVPPAGWEPKCKLNDDMRFDVTNQYISRLFRRWGPASRELCAIIWCLQQQKINTRSPMLDGVEINLHKLYHLVQRLGGIESVMKHTKWGKVAKDLLVNRTPYTEKKLDQIYVKFLLSYATLTHKERQAIMRKMEKAWHKKNQKLLDHALNPLHRQKYMLGESDSSDDDSEDEGTSIALAEAEHCIVPGVSMNLHKFKKVAANVYDNHTGVPANALCNSAGPSTAVDGEPSVQAIEHRYWQIVLMGTEHVCINNATIVTGQEGYGFTKNVDEPYGSHPWNLKMFIQNKHNMLRYLGPVPGVTVPTLHLSMLYSTSCWHKDKHKLPCLEYEHKGADKIWYAIPHDQADNFRKAVETLIPTSCQDKAIWLALENGMIPPHILCQHNVSLSRVEQSPNEFVLVFPNAYTCSISTGYAESEKVYFAPKSWLSDLNQVFQETRESCEPTKFSLEKLLLAIAKDCSVETCILKDIQPLLDKIITEETKNRRILEDSGIKVVKEAPEVSKHRKRNITSEGDSRDQEECDYCHCTLYLSKVRGLTNKKSSLCLEHAIKLQKCPKYSYKKMAQIELFAYVSVQELNTISENVKRRLEKSAS